MKKVFFVISSLSSGGSERVFWLLSQYFDKTKYSVYLVILDSTRPFFSTELDGVTVVDLKTIKASSSFFPLYRLLRKERPFAVYSTLSHINILLSLLSVFIKVPKLIARESSIPNQTANFGSLTGRIVTPLISVFYRRFDTIVCQSREMKDALCDKFKISSGKIVLIPNPVVEVPYISHSLNFGRKKMIVVGRLVPEKGHFRLLDSFKNLPEDYFLTITGDGLLRDELEQYVADLQLNQRITFTGALKGVTKLIADHDLLLMSSLTEGFPNVVIEALSVGVPVVAFRVGGISEIIIDGFNGFIIEQGDLLGFQKGIEVACNKTWDRVKIKEDALSRFAIDKIVSRYESLLN